MAISAECERVLNHTLKGLAAGHVEDLDLDAARFETEADQQLIAGLKGVADLLKSVVKYNEEVAQGRVDVIERTGEGRVWVSMRSASGMLAEIVTQADTIARGDYTAAIAPRGEQDSLGKALFEMTKTLREVGQICEGIAVGDFSKKVELKGDKDLLGRAVNQMVDNFKEIVTQVDTIACGNYTAEIAPRGEQDSLGKALFEMTRQLRELHDKNTREGWLKTGQADLVETMRGELEPRELARRVITHLTKYVNGQVGVLYLSDSSDASDTLHLSGSYAHTHRKKMNTTLELGEGLVGQAALERETIVVRDIEDDYVMVSSALGEQSPRNLVISPFVAGDALKGVLEIGSVKPLADDVLVLLRTASESIAIAFNTAQQRERTESLLQETQRQAEELQSQQEELASQNEELTEQTANLKRSEEHLREQSDELKASNGELEEQSEALRKQKEEIQAKNTKVELAKKDLEAQARELELASQYKSEFLANMSHELRTPLNSLLILADGLAKNKDGNLTPKQIEKATIIHDGGKDLLTLINDILDLSKVEAGKLDVQIETLDLAGVLEHVQRHFTPVAQEKQLEFNVVSEEGVPLSIRTDGQRLQQILRNLASNALKFTETGSITIRTHLPASTVSFRNKELKHNSTVGFSVIDTGIGIPQDKQRSIFEAFQQADGSTSRRFGGTGLGLTISRELAKLLGGEIAVQSQEGKGSTFTLYVPVAGHEATVESSARTQRATQAPRETPQKSIAMSVVDIAESAVDLAAFLDQSFVPDDRLNIGKNDRTVLIIEDDKAFANIMVEFSRDKGFKCLTAGDGRSGIEQAIKHLPNSIILDIGLPKLDGLQVLDALKDDLKTRHIPIHIVSAQDEETASKQKGALGFLKKPASEEALLQVFEKFEKVLGTSIRRLLVIEDNVSSQKAMEELLGTQDLAITCVASGKQAREEILASSFDCIVLDLGLEDMTGFELLSRLHDEDHVELPPVIVYTGKELTEAEEYELNTYTQSIVVKGAGSPERLLDDVSLFLHSVESTLPGEQRRIIRMLHDPEAALHGKTILVVDDDMRNTFALSGALEEVGCKVLQAGNGKMALEVLATNEDIDLVIMDIMMPVMDGFEAMKKIREDPRFAKLPIIALTAMATPQDRKKSLEAGASDYVTKPVDMEQLGSLMRVWLHT